MTVARRLIYAEARAKDENRYCDIEAVMVGRLARAVRLELIGDE